MRQVGDRYHKVKAKREGKDGALKQFKGGGFMQKQRRRAAVKEAAKAEAEETDEVKEAKRLKAVAKQAKEAHKAAEKQVVATTMELNGIEAAVTAGTATPKDLSEAQANQKQAINNPNAAKNGLTLAKGNLAKAEAAAVTAAAAAAAAACGDSHGKEAASSAADTAAGGPETEGAARDVSGSAKAVAAAAQQPKQPSAAATRPQFAVSGLKRPAAAAMPNPSKRVGALVELSDAAAAVDAAASTAVAYTNVRMYEEFGPQRHAEFLMTDLNDRDRQRKQLIGAGLVLASDGQADGPIKVFDSLCPEHDVLLTAVKQGQVAAEAVAVARASQKLSLNAPRDWRYVIGVIPGKLGTDKLRYVTGQQLSNQQQHNLYVGGTVTDWPIQYPFGRGNGV